jgi:hypothetical protein
MEYHRQIGASFTGGQKRRSGLWNVGWGYEQRLCGAVHSKASHNWPSHQVGKRPERRVGGGSGNRFDRVL